MREGTRSNPYILGCPRQASERGTGAVVQTMAEMLAIEGKAVVERVVVDEQADEVVVWVRPFRADRPRCGRRGSLAPGY
jgi:hypothetical protein